MVKRPRQVKRYSPSAGKHTLHTVERVKRSLLATSLGSEEIQKGNERLPWFPKTKPDGRENQLEESMFCTDALKLERLTTHLAKEQRNSNLSTTEVKNYG